MDVVIGELGNVKVDNVRDARDINAAADYIGGDQYFDFAAPEAFHHLRTRALRHVAVHGADAVNLFFEAAKDAIGSPFGPAKDNRLLRLFPSQQLHKQIKLLGLIDGEIKLFDGLDGNIVDGKVQMYRVAHVRAGTAVQ